MQLPHGKLWFILRRFDETILVSHMNSTSNSVTAVEVGQLVFCILGVILGLAGVITLTACVAIAGAVGILMGLGCFALQQALGD